MNMKTFFISKCLQAEKSYILKWFVSETVALATLKPGIYKAVLLTALSVEMMLKQAPVKKQWSKR